jgi:hypothetical protein
MRISILANAKWLNDMKYLRPVASGKDGVVSSVGLGRLELVGSARRPDGLTKAFMAHDRRNLQARSRNI